jgi:hypothetical protein
MIGMSFAKVFPRAREDRSLARLLTIEVNKGRRPSEICFIGLAMCVSNEDCSRTRLGHTFRPIHVARCIVNTNHGVM